MIQFSKTFIFFHQSIILSNRAILSNEDIMQQNSRLKKCWIKIDDFLSFNKTNGSSNRMAFDINNSLNLIDDQKYVFLHSLKITETNRSSNNDIVFKNQTESFFHLETEKKMHQESDEFGSSGSNQIWDIQYPLKISDKRNEPRMSNLDSNASTQTISHFVCLNNGSVIIKGNEIETIVPWDIECVEKDLTVISPHYPVKITISPIVYSTYHSFDPKSQSFISKNCMNNSRSPSMGSTSQPLKEKSINELCDSLNSTNKLILSSMYCVWLLNSPKSNS